MATALSLYLDGCLYFASSWITDAIMVLDMALTMNPPDPLRWSILLKLGECHMRERDIPRALGLLDKVLAEDSCNCRAILLKAGYYASVLNELEALRVLDAGIERVEAKTPSEGQFDPLYSTLVVEKLRLESNARLGDMGPQIKRRRVNNTPLLEKLPPELITKVMEQLDQTSFINCLATCRDWRSSLLSIPKLLGSFVLKSDLTLPMFNNYLRYLGEVAPLETLHIDKLNISCTRSDEKQVLKKLLASGLSLRSLRLKLSEVTNFELVRMQHTTCTKLFHTLNELDITLNISTKGTKSIEGVLEMCTQLRSLKLNIRHFIQREAYKRTLPPKKRFSIPLESIYVFNGPEIFLTRLFVHFQMAKLTTFHLRDTFFSRQTYAAILDSTVCLKHMRLSIGGTYPLVDLISDMETSGAEACKHYESLAVWYSTPQQWFETPETIPNPVDFASLRELDLRRDRTPFNYLMQQMSKCPSLVRLKLVDFVATGGPSSFSIRLLLQTFPALRSLSLLTHPIRSDVVATLAMEIQDMAAPPKLDMLETNCKSIVEMLRKGRRLRVRNLVWIHSPVSTILESDLRPLLASGVVDRVQRMVEQ